ncbi:M56 family metallopeptidase [Arthrobacter sp. KK5.5]|uniref:M56 family metallopeptidase n=1 Tax=Arthrobacter sp. KK5.5 TaxID=3373084 RepID=UPI003EE47BE6
MLIASYLLAGLAVILAWPAPVLLSRMAWTSRSPFTALFLWQAIALAGGLSMIGAMLVWGLEPLGANLIAALAGLWQVLTAGPSAPSLEPVHVFALSTALLLGSHLVFTLLLSTYRVARQRQRHRRLLALLSDPSPTTPGTVVLAHGAPVAYCLPGFNGSLTVLSRGLLDALDDEGLRGVIAHERAHLDQRHDLLVLAFESWHNALPWLPTSRLARDAVQELIEMLADDTALRHVSADTLLRSLVAVASGTKVSPGSESGLPSEELSSMRLKRLLSPSVGPLPLAGRAAVLGSSALLIVLPTTLLVAPWLLA